MTAVWLAAAVLALGALFCLARGARSRNMHLWFPSYLGRKWAGARESVPRSDRGAVHILFCIADHFEPGVSNPGLAAERRRVDKWVREYPRIAAGFRDADGRPPQHTFFFPAEEYRPEHVKRLADLAAAGCGEVEVHLHHDADTADGLREKLMKFKQQLRSHGCLGSDRKTGEAMFGFVHGNWALDNSLPDGRWCGVSDELRVLSDCGCYADFTLPSAPSPAQTRRINSIYYVTSHPDRPRSHDDGVEVRAGGTPTGDLLLVQGPLAVEWFGGRFGLLPRIETGNLAGGIPITPRRVATWVQARVCVAGRPDWIFVKLYTHGCNERNWDVLFGPPIRRMHEHLCSHYNDGARYKLHYVTAREMRNMILAAERGLGENPGACRDLAIAPPPLLGAGATGASLTQAREGS